MSKDYLDKWEERAKQNTEIIEQQQTKTKMSEKREIKPRLFKVTAGERYYDKYFIIAYTANDALQMIMDRFELAQNYALNIKSVECINVDGDGDYASDLMISPECIQGGLQNKII